MKKLFILFLLCLLWVAPAGAFLYDDVKFMTTEEIMKLSDQELYERYVDTKVIEKASQEFHIANGFSNTKEYGLRRKVIRLIFDLRMEMLKRESLDPAKVDENMR